VPVSEFINCEGVPPIFRVPLINEIDVLSEGLVAELMLLLTTILP
jgi:hypothetical protein